MRTLRHKLPIFESQRPKLDLCQCGHKVREFCPVIRNHSSKISPPDVTASYLQSCTQSNFSPGSRGQQVAYRVLSSMAPWRDPHGFYSLRSQAFALWRCFLFHPFPPVDGSRSTWWGSCFGVEHNPIANSVLGQPLSLSLSHKCIKGLNGASRHLPLKGTSVFVLIILCVPGKLSQLGEAACFDGTRYLKTWAV